MREQIDVETILTPEQIARANALGLENWCHPHELRLLREQAREICPPPAKEEDLPVALLFDLDDAHLRELLDRTHTSFRAKMTPYDTPTPAAYVATLVLEHRFECEEALVAAEIVAGDPKLAAMLAARVTFLAQGARP